MNKCEVLDLLYATTLYKFQCLDSIIKKHNPELEIQAIFELVSPLWMKALYRKALVDSDQIPFFETEEGKNFILKIASQNNKISDDEYSALISSLKNEEERNDTVLNIVDNIFETIGELDRIEHVVINTETSQ